MYVCMYVCMYKGWAIKLALARRPLMIYCACIDTRLDNVDFIREIRSERGRIGLDMLCLLQGSIGEHKRDLQC
jgi:hypothetical protein